VKRVSDVVLLIMAALATSPKHGYAIMQEVDRVAGKHMGPGTLYSAIARLEEAGYVEALAGDERRRPYRLTARGRKVLEEETQNVKTFSRSLQRLSTT
jgi:DNA-binding PadR family transcriptional regulator